MYWGSRLAQCLFSSRTERSRIARDDRGDQLLVMEEYDRLAHGGVGLDRAFHLSESSMRSR